tara:strand:+ start:230 stop:394 length:165 start_codon:yes stop_codon:yes gene_type:complete
MIIDLNLEERSLMALLIKDELSLLIEYRKKSILENNIQYYNEKIDSYKIILQKI